MSTKSREVIYGGRIIVAKIRGEDGRQRAADAAREADPVAAELWSIQMKPMADPLNPLRPSANASMADTAGLK